MSVEASLLMFPKAGSSKATLTMAVPMEKPTKAIPLTPRVLDPIVSLKIRVYITPVVIPTQTLAAAAP